MSFRIRNEPDFYSGLLFSVIGLAFCWLSTDYRVGSSAQMGPGYFPMVLGSILAAIGFFICARSTAAFAVSERIPQMNMRIVLLVLVSVAAFAVLLRPAGLILAAGAMMLISSLASHETSWKTTLITTVVLITACVIIFIYGLKLPMPVWPGQP